MKKLKTHIIFIIGSLILSFGTIMSMEQKSDVLGKHHKLWNTLYIATGVAAVASVKGIISGDPANVVGGVASLSLTGGALLKLCDIKNRHDLREEGLRFFGKLPDKDDKCGFCFKEFSLSISPSMNLTDDQIPFDQWVYLKSCCKQFMCKACYKEIQNNPTCMYCRERRGEVKMSRSIT